MPVGRNDFRLFCPVQETSPFNSFSRSTKRDNPMYTSYPPPGTDGGPAPGEQCPSPKVRKASAPTVSNSVIRYSPTNTLSCELGSSKIVCCFSLLTDAGQGQGARRVTAPITRFGSNTTHAFAKSLCAYIYKRIFFSFSALPAAVWHRVFVFPFSGCQFTLQGFVSEFNLNTRPCTESPRYDTGYKLSPPNDARL